MRMLSLISLLLVSVCIGCAGLPENQPNEAVVKTETVSKPEAASAPTSERIEVDAGLISPSDFTYLGAFRLPYDGERPLTFAYGGEAMTFRPDGDPNGAADGFPGSLFIMGHNRMPYDELPDGNQVAEIAIPEPVPASDLPALPRAEFLQPFSDVASGRFTAYEEIPRTGMEYLDHPETGPLIHLAWGQHFHDEPETQGPTHAWFSPDLSEPQMEGSWYIGSQSPYSVNGYLFSIPEAWAETHTGGRMLVTGRFRDGGWSGMGPSLYAYKPWTDASGTPAPDRTHLEEIVLLQYAKSTETEQIERCLEGYQHGDEWEGGAWLTTGNGNAAVLLAGTKSSGDYSWYGFISAAGPEFPCLPEAFLGQFTLCRLADGTPCPDEQQWICTEPASGRGWWSDRFTAQFIFYDPEDLARVSAGELEPWEPQPYAVLDIDEHLYLNPAGIDTEFLGFGPQRRYRIGDVAYDRENGLVYVLELFADEAQPVVHVWRVEQQSFRAADMAKL